MDYRDNTFDADIPLCSFGPGGDFTSHWSELLKETPPAETRLGRLLMILAEVVTATAASGHYPSEDSECEAVHTPNIRIVKTETRRGVHIKANRPTDAKATGASKAGGAIPDQLLLFGLDAGACGESGDKQNHSLRAHRRVAKKKPSLGGAGEGSLFEPDRSRAISA